MDAQRAFRFAASMNAGLVLFSAVALASVAGSLGPEASRAVYGSLWFSALLGLLALNAALCAVSRFPGLRRGGRGGVRGWSVYLLHISVVLVAAAGFWANARFTVRDFAMAEGESAVVAGMPTILRSVRVERYPDGSVSDWVSRIERDGKTMELRVNKPARFGDAKLLQAGYGRYYTVSVQTGAKSPLRLLGVSPGDRIPLSRDGSASVVLEQPPDGLLAAASEASGARRAVDLVFLDGKRAVKRATVFEGVPLSLDGEGAALCVVRSVGVSGFVERDAPGLAFLWAALGLLALSSCGLLVRARPGARAGSASESAAAGSRPGPLLGARQQKGGAA